MLKTLARFNLALTSALAAATLLTSASPAALATSVIPPYPYADPYLASVTVRLMKTSRMRPTTVLVEGLPGRNQVPLIEGRGAIEVSLFAQPRPATLIYVLPGLGGSATDGAALWVAEQLYLRGFSAMVLPSPMNWHFVVSQSTSAIPGYAPEDAKDLRRLMLNATTKAQRELGLRVTRSALAGYSLGAINAAFIMKQERANPTLGLERVVMINPPLDIPTALTQLDSLNAIGAGWPERERNALLGGVIELGSLALKRDVADPGYFYGIDRILPFSMTQVRYLIGNSFRETLAETIFASQQINDVGLLKRPATRGSRSMRQLEAQSIGFQRYLSEVAGPYWRQRRGRGMSINAFVSSGEISSLRSTIASDPAYRLMHNEDDFLNSRVELRSLASSMGSRAVVYPVGGHCGNLWYPQHSADFMAMLADLR